MTFTMANHQNVTSMITSIIQRETHSCQRGAISRDLLSAAEDKAASCEMDELSCKVPENTRSTFLFTFSPDGTKVASAHGNHKIYVSDVGSGKCLHTLEGHPRTPWCITFHPNYEGVLASGCLGGEVRVWDLHGGCEVWVGMKNSAICSLSFHPFDRVLVIATTNTIYFWDWSQSQPFANCKSSCDKEKVRFVQFDSYGHRLFTGIANVTPIYRQREFTASYTIDQENSGNGRISTLLELQHFRGRNQRFHSSNIIEEGPSEGTEPSISPSFSDNLRLAREYAAAQTAHSVDENTSRHYGEISNNSSQLSYERLLERILDLRSSITQVCEQLQSLLLPSHSELYLANCLFRFWRDISTLMTIMRSGLEVQQSYLEARRRISDYLFQLQERMHIRSYNDYAMVHPISGQSVRRHRRLQYIYNIMAKLLELFCLDFNMLVRRTTRSDENGHGAGGILIHAIDSSVISCAVSELRDLAVQHGLLFTGGAAVNLSHSQSFSVFQDIRGANEESAEAFRLQSGSVTNTSREIPSTSRLSGFQLNDENLNDEINAEQILGHILDELFNHGERLNIGRRYSHQPHSSSFFTHDLSQHLRTSLYANGLMNNQRSSPYMSHAHRAYNGVPEPLFVTRANYRIQCWDFSKFVIPDISNAHVNVVVPECLIQNDASIEISADGQLLATLVPSSSPTANILAIYSIRSSTFGQCLYMWNFVSSVISISLSPLGRYVLVGLGSNRRSLDNNGGKLVIGQVLKLIEGNDETRECVQHVRTVELRGENRFDVSLNSMRWLPYPGHGLVYGTNRGDLRICRPKSFNESGVRPPSSQWIGHDLARTLPWRSRLHRTGSFMLQSSTFESFSNASNSLPSTSSTGTQTEAEHDSA